MYSTTRSRAGRKRQSSESSAEAPKAKRKKLRAKDPPLLASHAQSPPPEATATSTEVVVAPETTTRSKRGASTSKAGKTARATQETSEQPSSVQEPSPTISTSTDKKPSHKRSKSKNYYLKPQNKSWMSHIAAVVVHRCVSEATKRSFDPRAHLSDINWTLMAERLFSSEDMKKVWYYIGKEFPDAPLNEISVNLQPYADLSIDELIREDIRIKYKDQMPKVPVSAYLLFSRSKAPKLKEKHPELSQTEIAVRLGKRWNSIGAEKQEKYKQQYAALRRNYTEEIEQFYQDHPDARPPLRVSKKKTRKITVASPEDRRFQEVKAAMPKLPVSGYLLFCKAKREKLHRKNPELSPTEVTVKLGKKWQSIGEEGRGKYKKAYEESAQIYKQQLEEFYAQNPDAKEILQTRKKKKAPKISPSQTSVWTQTLPPPISPEETRESPLPTIMEEGEEEEGGVLEVDLTEGRSQERNEASSESEEDSDSSDSEDE